MQIGTRKLGEDRFLFTVWAPLLKTVSLKIVAPAVREIPLVQDEWGYWRVVVDNLKAGARYWYCLDGAKIRPDPVSHYQPLGVHEVSELVDQTTFIWEDQNWGNVPLSEMIIYELHVGTFTPAGTFSAIIPRLPELLELGINTIELMPVAQFPGRRNWGYDGVYPFAAQNSYGGPRELKKLVAAAHKLGIAVLLDVVYNHLGPEGNYLRDFGPYFTNKYQTNWGEAINFDAAYSDQVRNYFCENALHWFEHYHIDGLRLDALHAVFDMSAKPFLLELSEKVAAYSARGKKCYLIAESDANDARLIKPANLGGYGLDAQWCDDYHHALHAVLTGENTGYYADFGELNHLAKALREGFVYSGEYSRYRKRRHGSSFPEAAAQQFIVFSQNHDQVGNHFQGERLSRLVSFAGLKLAAAAVILSPYVPLLFMGEEYGETAPFHYFIEHADRDLIAAVRQGRQAEFASFQWDAAPPDPQSEATFQQCQPAWELKKSGEHRVLYEFYRRLLQLRKTVPALRWSDNKSLDVSVTATGLLSLRRWHQDAQVFWLCNFQKHDVETQVELPAGTWNKLLDSAAQRWLGAGESLPQKIVHSELVTLKAESCAVFEKVLA